MLSSVDSPTYSHDRRSRSWARASRATRGAVVGVLLDQGQGLEHRVVQVRGDVGALLGAHPLGALVAEVGGEPVDPRPDHDGQADDRQQRRDHDVAGHLERPAAHGVEDQRQHDQADARRDAGVRRPAAAAEHDPHRVDPAGAVQPPLALRLVGLAPQQRDADDADHDRPEHRASAEHRLEQQDRAEAERGQRDRGADVAEPPDPARPAAAAGRALQARGVGLEVRVRRQQPPEAGVEDDAEAAEERAPARSRRAPRGPGSRGVGRGRRRPRRGSAPGCRGRRAVLPNRGRRACVGGGTCTHRGSIVTQRSTPDHEG